jgi:hypothetical protein
MSHPDLEIVDRRTSARHVLSRLMDGGRKLPDLLDGFVANELDYGRLMKAGLPDRQAVDEHLIKAGIELLEGKGLVRWEDEVLFLVPDALVQAALDGVMLSRTVWQGNNPTKLGRKMVAGDWEDITVQALLDNADLSHPEVTEQLRALGYDAREPTVRHKRRDRGIRRSEKNNSPPQSFPDYVPTELDYAALNAYTNGQTQTAFAHEHGIIDNSMKLGKAWTYAQLTAAAASRTAESRS